MYGCGTNTLYGAELNNYGERVVSSMGVCGHGGSGREPSPNSSFIPISTWGGYVQNADLALNTKANTGIAVNVKLPHGGTHMLNGAEALLFETYAKMSGGGGGTSYMYV